MEIETAPKLDPLLPSVVYSMLRCTTGMVACWGRVDRYSEDSTSFGIKQNWSWAQVLPFICSMVIIYLFEAQFLICEMMIKKLTLTAIVFDGNQHF